MLFFGEKKSSVLPNVFSLAIYSNSREYSSSPMYILAEVKLLIHPLPNDGKESARQA